MGERTFLVRQREDDARLIGLHQRAQHIGLIRIRYYKKSGEVVLVVLNVIFKNLQTVEFGCLSVTNSSPPSLLTFGNHLRRTSGVLSLHILQLWVLGQELTALHQRHRMRVDFCNRLPVVFRQTADAMGDVQLVLSDNRGSGVTEQLIVVEQGACNGILDGEHTDGSGILLDTVKDLFES